MSPGANPAWPRTLTGFYRSDRCFARRCVGGTGRKRMNRPALVATVVIGAMLSAGVLDRSFDLAAAGPIAASSDPPPQAVAPPPAANQPAIGPHGRAYLFRGALGPIFSRGMDRLTERLEQAGIRANAYEFTICRLIAEQA